MSDGAALKRAFDTAHTAGWPDGQRCLVDLSQLTRTAREPLSLTKDRWLALVLEARRGVTPLGAPPNSLA